MKNVIDSFKLNGKTALVTGGANGLGKVMAEGLAQAGANIIICDLDMKNAEITAKEIIEEYGVKCSLFYLDVTDHEKAEGVIDQIEAEVGPIDILLNNSGIWSIEEAEKMSWDNWYNVINVCLNGTFIVSQAVGKKMIERKSGNIINISSISGEIVNDAPFKCSYNAAKAGVIMLTKALAAEWARYGIRVNSISPSSMKQEEVENAITPRLKRVFEMTLMHRRGYSHELCGALIYLASEASSYVTGAVIPVQGGDGIWKGLDPFPTPK